MHDRVADVLAQRASLDRGAGTGIVVSVLLHAGLAGVVVYAATHASAPQAAKMVSIQFANVQPAAPVRRAEARRSTPKIEEPKPKIEEPKPVVEQKPPKIEKNTVPLSPFGRSTKKGSETPPVAKPVEPPPAAPVPGTTTDVAAGASGVTGIEGGDFPYTLYLNGMHRKIGANWFRPHTVKDARTVVYFRILRDGTITDAKIETSSGNATFDRAALSAVRSASPLNALPFGYQGTHLGVHLTFR